MTIWIKLIKYLPGENQFPKEKLLLVYESLRESFTKIQTAFSSNLSYLGPLREYPKRYYPISGDYPATVGIRGEKATEVIYYHFKRKKDNFKTLEDLVRKADFGDKIEIRTFDNVYSIIIHNPMTKTGTNLADMGFGTSQFLPIVIQGLILDKGSTLIVEQPEIHLHPRLQAELADFLIKLKNADKNVLIETHSEHVILRLQRRIAEGKLSSDDVAIYYFDKTSQGSHITEVKLNKNGTLQRWPKGFFEEDFEDSMKLLRTLGNNEEQSKAN
jgi:predicted ATPase